jgi:hypothetical protein
MRKEVHVESFLKVGENFVPVTKFSGRVEDADYIAGAIRLTVGDVDLLTVEMWDLVDQLWAYLVNGLVAVCKGEEFRTCFPDQPIEIVMKPDASKRRLSVEVAAHERRLATADYRTVFSALLAGADEFFQRMGEIPGTNRQDYSRVIKKIADLRVAEGL